MKNKNFSNKVKINLIELFSVGILLFLTFIYFWSVFNPNKLSDSSQVSTTTSTTLLTTTTVLPTNKSLTREVFLDIKSGEGLLWFSNATVSDVRLAMAIWQEKVNHIINFEEVRGESVADIVIKFSGSFNNSSPGKKTIGEAYVYLGQVRGTIYILPSAMTCRNQVRTMHEIGHIIGLNHSANHYSVMYPLESCTQNITAEDARTAFELINQFL